MTLTMTTAMSEKKKGATPVPSGEEEESGSTVSEPTARQFEQLRWEAGRTEESSTRTSGTPTKSRATTTLKAHTPIMVEEHGWTNETI
mmetsp:Transcript_2711/g.3033  ORF Transcript_2711/g.3033 Transcript_2711/m.3033 type:complete len:88 (-) Transcript_2711:499-762(-)